MKMIGWRPTTCALVMALSMSGCGTEADEAAQDPAVTITQPILDGDYYSWNGGDGALTLTNAPLASSVCFLSGISGTLKNTTTSLQQMFVTDGSNGTYWVAGSSAETRNKAIEFSCLTGRPAITRSQYTTHYWTSSARDPAPVDMGPTSDRVCLLTKVEGWFNGPGEEVRVRTANGRWLLDGKQGSLHPYSLGAGAVCIRGVSAAIDEYSPEFTITSPANGRATAALPYPWNILWNDYPFCGLTRINGKFSGSRSADYARVWANQDGRLLDVRGYDGPITMGVRCLMRTAL